MAAFDVIHVGNERSPVVVIDSFAGDPESLVDLAAEAVFIDVGSIYPGVRAPAPGPYVETLLAATASLITQVFGARCPEELDLAAFSIVTAPPALLRPIQRIPHFDGPDEERIAFLHYLCAPNQGGTSFFRHRATNIERVRRDRVEEYRDMVVSEFRSEAPARRYAGEDSRFFERIHRVDAAFNRLIIYKGNTLHSGDILTGTVLSEDPRQGRLTINGFGRLRSDCQAAND